MGSQLVFRSQSGTELNPKALQLVNLAGEIEKGLDALRRDQQMLAGTLRVSVPDGMAPLLARSLIAFRREHPGVDVELAGENRMVDVSAREADIAVRLTRSTSNVVIEKHLASFRFSLFASADYVRQNIPTRRLAKGEASTHTFVGLDIQWRELLHEQWMAALGATRFAFRSSSIEAILEAVRAGIGLAALLEKDPRNADLIRVDTEVAGPSQSFYLVYHHNLRQQPHVRAAIASIEAYVSALDD